jgi:hypothetical protein
MALPGRHRHASIVAIAIGPAVPRRLVAGTPRRAFGIIDAQPAVGRKIPRPSRARPNLTSITVKKADGLTATSVDLAPLPAGHSSRPAVAAHSAPAA